MHLSTVANTSGLTTQARELVDYVLLHQPYRLEGKVIHGDAIGRTLGFPTANLDTLPDPNVIFPGVHAVTSFHQGELWKGLLYVGPRLVMGEQKSQSEVYFYDISVDLYDQVLAVDILAWMRPPQPFTSLQALQQQLNRDKANGVVFFSQYGSA